MCYEAILPLIFFSRLIVIFFIYPGYKYLYQLIFFFKVELIYIKFNNVLVLDVLLFFLQGLIRFKFQYVIYSKYEIFPQLLSIRN